MAWEGSDMAKRERQKRFHIVLINPGYLFKKYEMVFDDKTVKRLLPPDSYTLGIVLQILPSS